MYNYPMLRISPFPTHPTPPPHPILYFIVYITVCRGWVGVCVMYTIENHHLHLGGGASAREDSASPREDKILPGTCISFLQRWGSSIDETPPLIITNHPPYHLQQHWWPSLSLAHRFASFLDHTPPLNLHHCK